MVLHILIYYVTFDLSRLIIILDNFFKNIKFK